MEVETAYEGRTVLRSLVGRVLRCLALSTALFGVASAVEAHPQRPGWTILLYVSADDFDSSAYVDAVSDIAWAARGKSVVIYALIDQYADNPVSLLDQTAWTGTKLFRVEAPNLVPLPIQLPTGTDEANMGDPNTLAEFLRRTLRLCQSPYVSLWMMGHGMAANGVCEDACAGGGGADLLDPQELRDALLVGTSERSRQLDLVVLSSCHSGCLELLTAVAPACRHLVASEAYTCMRSGIDARSALGTMRGPNPPSPALFARELVATYRMQAECGCDNATMGQSIEYYDLCSLGRLVAAWDRMSRELGNRVQDEAARRAMVKVVERSRRIKCCLIDGPLDCKGRREDCCHRDMGALAESLLMGSSRADRQLRQEVADGLDGLVRASRQCWGPSDSSQVGLSTYVPCKAKVIDALAALLGESLAPWSALLSALYTSGCDVDPQPSVRVQRTPPGGPPLPIEAHAMLAPGMRPPRKAWMRIRGPAGSTSPGVLVDLPIDLSTALVGNMIKARWDGRTLTWNGGTGVWPVQAGEPVAGQAGVLRGTSPIWVSIGSGQAGHRMPMLAEVEYEPAAGEGRVLAIRSDGCLGLPDYAAELSDARPVSPRLGEDPLLLELAGGLAARGIQLAWKLQGNAQQMRVGFVFEDDVGKRQEYMQPE